MSISFFLLFPAKGNYTECQQREQLAQLTVDALLGNLSMNYLPGTMVAATVHMLLSEIHLQKIWMPACNQTGDYASAGCEINIDFPTSKDCFCVNERDEKRTDIPSSTLRPPNCLQPKSRYQWLALTVKYTGWTLY